MAWNDLAALLIVLALFGAVGWSMWAMWRPDPSTSSGYDSEIAPDSERDSEATPKDEPLRIAQDDRGE